MKKLLVVLLAIMIFTVLAVPVMAGTLNFNNITLPANGSVYYSGWRTKNTTSNGTYVWFDQNVGPVKSVNARTQANLPGIGIVNVNPAVNVFKGQTEWLGSYTTINLSAGTLMRIALWTGANGIQDTVSGSWDYE